MTSAALINNEWTSYDVQAQKGKKIHQLQHLLKVPPANDPRLVEAIFEPLADGVQAGYVRRPRFDIRVPDHSSPRLPLLSATILHKSHDATTFSKEDFSDCLYQTTKRHSRYTKPVNLPAEYVCDNGIIIDVVPAATSKRVAIGQVKCDTIYTDDLREILRATIRWAVNVEAYRAMPSADDAFPSTPFRPTTLQVLRNGITQGFISIDKGNERRQVSDVREPVGSRRIGTDDKAGTADTLGNTDSMQQERGTDATADTRTKEASKRPRLRSPEEYDGPSRLTPGSNLPANAGGTWPSRHRSSPDNDQIRQERNGWSVPEGPLHQPNSDQAAARSDDLSFAAASTDHMDYQQTHEDAQASPTFDRFLSILLGGH